MSKKAVVWSLPNCVMCNRTKQWLDSKGVMYSEEDLTLPEHADDLAFFKSLGHVQAPIVEVYDIPAWGTVWPEQLDLWSGFQPEKLEEHFA